MDSIHWNMRGVSLCVCLCAREMFNVEHWQMVRFATELIPKLKQKGTQFYATSSLQWIFLYSHHHGPKSIDYLLIYIGSFFLKMFHNKYGVAEYISHFKTENINTIQIIHENNGIVSRLVCSCVLCTFKCMYNNIV